MIESSSASRYAGVRKAGPDAEAALARRPCTVNEAPLSGGEKPRARIEKTPHGLSHAASAIETSSTKFPQKFIRRPTRYVRPSTSKNAPLTPPVPNVLLAENGGSLLNTFVIEANSSVRFVPPSPDRKLYEPDRLNVSWFGTLLLLTLPVSAGL